MVSENANHRLKLDIVTPEQLVFSDVVNALSAPGVDGELGILPRHCSLITILQPGELRIKKGEEEILVAIRGGFLEVGCDGVVILADMAQRDDKIDVQKAEEAKQRAEQALSEVQISAVDRAEAEVALRFELTRLKIAEKRKKKPKKMV